MKKKRCITMLAAAAVILSVCAPISLYAQEETGRMGTEETEKPDEIAEADEESPTVPEGSILNSLLCINICCSQPLRRIHPFLRVCSHWMM